MKNGAGFIKPKGTHYRQGYLLNDDYRTIRVRTTEEYGFITFKGATSGITRKEFEYKIPVEDGIELLDGFCRFRSGENTVPH